MKTNRAPSALTRVPRSSLSVAITAGLVMSIMPGAPAGAAASVTSASAILTDGTPSFDATDLGGNDSSSTNGIVRTFDIVTYEMTIANSGLGNDINNATIRSTLPVGMVWSALDPTCRPATAIPTPVPASSISADRRTIVCNIGTRNAGSLVKTPLQAYPLSTVPDGTVMTADFTLEYNDPGLANARISQPGGSSDVIVSAGKPTDLSHNDNVAPVLGLQYLNTTTVVAIAGPISGTVTNNGSPVPGATVNLYGSSNTPLIDAGTGLPYVATTDASGNYAFTNVPAGTVRIRVTSGIPTGQVALGSADIQVVVQGQAIDADFNYVNPFSGVGPATISGTLFSDVDRNTVQNIGDLGIDAVTLTLTGYDASGNPVSQTVDTDTLGNYSFSVPASDADGYTILASGRKVAFYLPVVSSRYNVVVGVGEVRDLDIPWNLDINLGKAIVTRIPVAIKAPAGGKGVSALGNVMSWQEDVPPGAFSLGCGYNTQVQSLNPLPGGIGGGANNVVNSGSWTCTQPGGPGTPIQVTVSGADTTGTTFPTRNYNGTIVLPANERFLATGWVGVARPDPGCGVSLPAMSIQAGSFTSSTPSGAPAGDLYPETNTAQVAALAAARACPTLPGTTSYLSVVKQFTKDGAHAWAGTANVGAPITNQTNTFGNAIVPATLPFGTYIQATNSSTLWDVRNVNVCDSFDRTRFTLKNRPGISPASPFQLTISNPQTPFANRLLYQYGSTAAFDAASPTSGAFVVEVGLGAPWANLAAQRNASCADPTLTWVAWDPANPMLQSDLDLAVMFRVRAKALQPSDSILLRAQMAGVTSPATSTYAGIGLVPLPSPDRTFANSLSYAADFQTASVASPVYTRFADPAVGVVRTNKFDPNVTGTISSAALGDTVLQRIDVTANGVFPETGLIMRDVVVVDTIPAGTTYVAGSANIAPESIVPSGGNTIITWNLGNLATDIATYTITYQVRVGDDLSTGTVLTNSAVVSSIDDSSPAALRTDTHQISVTAPQEFRIFKITPDAVVEPDDRFSFQMGYRNLATTPLPSQDFIDVLPYVGDGRSTSFSGAYTFDPGVTNPITPHFVDDAVYVTSAAPGTINRDPGHATNAIPYAGSGTRWCRVPTDFGSTGCPTSSHDSTITAFRVVSTHSMSNTDPTRTITAAFRATGDLVGDVFRNNFSARAPGLATWVQSSAVQVTVARGSISNLVWADQNKNGRQDAGEPGIPGVTVTLRGRDFQWNGTAYVLRNDYDATPLTAITDASGIYRFDDLNHGEYELSVPVSITYSGELVELTLRDTVMDTVDSDADAVTGSTVRFCLGESPDTTSSALCPNFVGRNKDQDSWDFGYFGKADIGDLVWEDTNGNGRQDAGEPGLSGWTVNLLGAGVDGLFNTGDETVINTTSTDGSGNYRFIDQIPGRYMVEFVPASGYRPTASNTVGDSIDSDIMVGTNRIDVTARSNRNTTTENLSFDGGYYRPVGVSDRVWVDDNANGIQDPTEGGLDGVRVDLLTSAGAAVTNSLGQPMFTITGDDPSTPGMQMGYYKFEDRVPGSYRVRFTAPFGYAITVPGSHSGPNLAGTASDSDPDRTGNTPIVLRSGDGLITDIDAGMFKPVTISDFVWADTDRDGVQDPSELGLSGVTVRLVDEAGTPVLNASGVAYVVVTGSFGLYEFRDLFPRPATDPARYYRVRFDLPASYRWTGPSAITAPDQTSVPSSGSALTDSDTTWTSRTQANAQSGRIYLASGEQNSTVDAGLYRPVSIGDFVWSDTDGDGFQDGGEPGLAGVTVSLLVRTGLGPDGLSGTADDIYGPAVDDDGLAVADVVTPGSGAYSFNDLPAGTYKVQVTWDDGLHVAPSAPDISGNALDTQDSDGTPVAGSIRTAASGPMTFQYGAADTNADFGFTATAAIGDFIFDDLNGNGIQDGGEPGAAGQEVTLWQAGPDGIFENADDVQVTLDANGEAFPAGGVITTPASGAYLFDDLAPGTYQVRVRTASTEWKPTTRLNPSSVATAANDSDLGPLGPDGRTAVMPPAAVLPGQSQTRADGGLLRAITISNQVFEDGDGDGVQDAGELGVVGASLTLWMAGSDGIFGNGDDVQVSADRDGTVFGTLGTVTTAAGGTYAFPNLAPGTYQVRVATPAGWVIGLDNQGSDPALDSNFIRTSPTTGSTAAVTVVSGDNQSTIDAAMYRPVSLGDFVWVDTDGDGFQDLTELGLSGATLTLETAAGVAVTSDAFGNAIGPVLSSLTGAYQFTNLAAGTYRVAAVLPGGYLPTASNVGSDDAVDSDLNLATMATDSTLVRSGANATGLDIGASRAITIGNRIWVDADADGVQDVAETTGIAGVQVRLLDPLGVEIARTTTDAAGNYLFSRRGADQSSISAALLTAGSYQIEFTRPTGFYAAPSTGLDVDNAANNDADFSAIDDATWTTNSFVITENSSELDIDAGFFETASIGDFIFEDTNGNGIQDGGEGGFSGLEVQLVDGNGVAAVDVFGDPVAPVTLTGTGLYSFSNLRPGDYKVRVVFDANTIGVSAADETTEASDSDLDATGLSGTVTLASGLEVTQTDGGLYRYATMGNRIWEDSNGDGIQNNGEVGLANITVTLSGTTGDGTAVTRTTVTDAAGGYRFGNLVPGTYHAVVGLPADWTTSPIGRGGDIAQDSDLDPISGATADTVLVSGESDTTWDGGLIQAPFVAGSVYIDADNDGVRDAGELGLAGQIMTLVGTDIDGNSVELFATTDATGHYVFSGVPTSDALGYTVKQVAQPVGSLDGKEFPGTAGGTTTTNDQIDGIVVKSGTSGLRHDFGELRPATLAGSVWVDVTGDNLFNPGEVGIAGVTITLTGTDDLGNPVTVTAVTDASGNYQFVGLRPGTYSVSESQPVGYTDGPNVVGSAGGSVIADDVVSGIVLTSGMNATNYGFTEVDPAQPGWASVDGTVWIDLDRDGVRDAAETAGVSGVVIELLRPDGTVVATTTTDASGHYEFVGFPSGEYLIRQVQPAGWTSTSPDVLGSIAVPINISSAGLTNMDFFEARGSISGLVFDDRDGDGIQGPTEAGIGGVTLTLTGVDIDGNPVSRTVTTTASGSYQFIGLPDSDASGYSITETQPGSWVDGIDTAGTIDGVVTGTVGSDVISGIVLSGGLDAINYTFGEQRAPTAPGTTYVGGHVYLDTDGDGLLSSGEGGLGGVTVQLLDSTGTVVVTTVTAPDGSYVFLNVVPGTYSVRQIQPAGYTSTSADLIGPIVVPASGLADANFGERLPGSGSGTAWLSGMVFNDENGDGNADSGESGIAGVALSLTDTFGNVIATTTTGTGGTYRFDGIAPGDYLVVQSQPIGMGSTTPNTLGPVSVPYTGSTGNHFGERLSSISAAAFVDVNGDGIRDAGESGIAGVEFVLTGTDANGNPVTLVAYSDMNGDVRFDDLLAGTYTITQTQPAGYNDGLESNGSVPGVVGNDVISGIALGAGVAATGYGFGEAATPIVTDPGTSAIFGFVWDDSDGDGIFGPGETPLGGVRVEIRDGSGALIGTAITTSDGRYVFTGLTPGATYSVTEIDPAGYGSSTPNGGLPLVAPVADTVGVGPNFGDMLGFLGGSVFDDLNRDGNRDTTEPGIGGVEIVLEGFDLLGNPVLLTTTTAADGTYQFRGLKSGNYTIREVQPAGYADGLETSRNIATDISMNDAHGAIELSAGQRVGDINFAEGIIPTTTTAISGFAFLDRGPTGTTSNGILDTGDLGFGGVTIILRDVNGIIVATTVTAPDGSYTFEGIAPGTYQVEALQPIGTGTSTPLVISNLTVPIDGIPNANFGFTKSSVIGHVFNDKNGNGSKDGSDAPIAGVTVTLTGTDAFGNPVLVSVVTGADGSFVFPDLFPSDPQGYTITETQPAGWLDGTDRLAVSGVLGADSFGGISVGAGQHLDVGTFAEFAGVAITGRVWDDTNGNGIQDAGEPGLPGVVVRLVGISATGQTITVEVTTGSDGSYVFTNVPPGQYHLEFVTNGLLPTYTRIGTNSGTDSDANGSGSTNTFTVGGANLPGSTDADLTDLDGGFVRPATIAGGVFIDGNGNGTRDPGEGAASCREVTLQGAGPDGAFGTADDPDPMTVAVDADGKFTAGGLMPGSYRVSSPCGPTQEVKVASGEVSPNIAIPVAREQALPKNTPTGALPKTGGSATSFLAIIGGFSIVAGGVLTRSSRRRAAHR